MKIIVSVICLLGLTFTFFTPVRSENSIIEVNLERTIKTKSATSLKEIANDISYIPLETNKECLLGKAAFNVIINNNKILILDETSCYVFDMTGRYLIKFIRQGKGPFESIQTFDIRFSNNNDRIYTVDPRAKKMIVYNTQYEPQYEFKTTFNSMNLCSFVNWIAYTNMAVDYDGSKVLFNIADSKGKIVKSIIHNRNPNWKIGMNFRSVILYEYNNKLIYKDKWCDTLYCVSPDLSIKPYMTLNLGRYKNTPGYKDTSGLTGKQVPKKGLVDIYNVIELDNFLITTIDGGHIIYNKKTMEISFFETKVSDGIVTGLTNDFDFGPSYMPKYKIDNNTTARLVYSFEGEFNNSSFRSKYPWVNKLKDNDNPVLMLVTHK